MKIHDSNDLGAISTPGAKGAPGAEGAGRREAGRSVESSGPDRAELSGLAGKIAGAEAQDTAQRAANVEQLGLQVAAGQYRPDAAAISRGIVNDALASAATAGSSKK